MEPGTVEGVIEFGGDRGHFLLRNALAFVRTL